MGIGIGTNYLRNNLVPSLSFDWLNNDSLRSLEGFDLTFSRLSSSTYWGADGLLKYADENLFLYSEDFDNAVWAKSGVNVVANSTIAPDGTLTADTIIPIVTNQAFKEIQQNVAIEYNTDYTFTGYVKTSGYRYIQVLGNGANFGNGYVNFDLQTGLETAKVDSNSNISSRGIVSIGSGWYRIWATYRATASGNGRIAFNIIPNSNSARGDLWSSDGTSGVYYWGLQINKGGLINYKKTTSTIYNGCRFDYNSKTREKRGALSENQGTNLLLRSDDYSNSYWLKTDVTVGLTSEVLGIRGNLNEASKIQEGTAGNAIFVSGAPNITANATYTCFHFIKRGNFDWIRLRFLDGSTNSNGANCWFNLANGTTGTIALLGTATGFSTYIIPLNNDYYMCCITGNIGGGYTTMTNHFVSATGDGQTTRVSSGYYYLSGSQIELGGYPTSYIPTSSTAITRSGDSLVMPTGSWFNNLEGSFVIEYANFLNNTDSGNRGLVSLSDGTANNGISILGKRTTNSANLTVKNANVTTVDLTTSGYSKNTFYKVGVSYKLDDFNLIKTGVNAVTDTLSAVPTCNTLTVGFIYDFSNSRLDGWIKSIKYYNKKIDNQTLKSLTS